MQCPELILLLLQKFLMSIAGDNASAVAVADIRGNITG
jgi:hypothetical protein